MQISQLKPWSSAVVAENKSPKTNEILAVPFEVLPFLDGEISGDEQELEHSGSDINEQEYTVTIKKRMAVRCKWMPWGSNRTTAPDVRRGERVEIYRFGDSDEYYWASIGLDEHLRRLETVIWRFSALPDGTSDDELTPDNCYVVEMSTHNKIINLTTSNANEEPVRYTFQFNTGEGVVTLQDDLGNYLQLDSTEHTWHMHNADDSDITMNKENIDVFVKGNIGVVAKKDISLDCKNLTFTVGGNFSSTVTGNFSVDAANSHIKSSEIKLEGKVLMPELEGIDGGDIIVKSVLDSDKDMKATGFVVK